MPAWSQSMHRKSCWTLSRASKALIGSSHVLLPIRRPHMTEPIRQFFDHRKIESTSGLAHGPKPVHCHARKAQRAQPSDCAIHSNGHRIGQGAQHESRDVLKHEADPSQGKAHESHPGTRNPSFEDEQRSGHRRDQRSDQKQQIARDQIPYIHSVGNSAPPSGAFTKW